MFPQSKVRTSMDAGRMGLGPWPPWLLVLSLLNSLILFPPIADTLAHRHRATTHTISSCLFMLTTNGAVQSTAFLVTVQVSERQRLTTVHAPMGEDIFFVSTIFHAPA
jgi:hypothetical protein